MNMKLISLEINNFKKLKSLKIEPNGNNCLIKGANGAGKTTIYDAFSWLMFGKNSLGHTNFGIRTTNAPYEVEPSVIAILDIDGKQIEFKKVLASKFSKQTGEFKETKTECYINGIKKAIRTYEKEIHQIIDEKLFMLLTNARYFNENMEWKERRAVLFDVCGAITEQDIVNNYIEFEPFKKPLETYGEISEYLKFLKTEQKKNSEDINKIPTRIDEVFKQIDTSLDEESLRAELETSNKELEKLEEKLINLKAGNVNTELANKIMDIDLQINSLKNENQEFMQEQKDKLEEKIRVAKNERDRLDTLRRNFEIKLEDAGNRLKSANAERNTLLKERKELLSSKWQGDINCPTCRKPLDEDYIEEAKGNFNEEKSKKLEENKKQGLKAREEVDKQSLNTKKLKQEISLIKQEIETIKEEITKIKTELETGIFELPNYKERIIELEQQKTALNTQKEKASNSTSEDVQALETQIQANREQKNTIQSNIAKVEQNKRLESRLNELRNEQKRLISMQGKTKKMLDLATEFTLKKISLITNEVNSKFRFTKFKLFEENKTNDDVKEMCEAYGFNSPDYKGVSNGQKTLIGLDIISVLSKHYNVTPVIFADNFDGLDSNNSKLAIDSICEGMQIITLKVSDDEELKIEMEDN